MGKLLIRAKETADATFLGVATTDATPYSARIGLSACGGANPNFERIYGGWYP